MADKSSGSEKEYGNPMHQISYKRKYCRVDSDRESEKETSDVSMDSFDVDDSITNHKILGSDKSLTLAQANDDKNDDKSSLWGEKKNRTPRKLTKLKDTFDTTVEEGLVKDFEDQGALEEKGIIPHNDDHSMIIDEGSFITQQSQVTQEEELTDECQSRLPASSPEAEEKPESPLRLFSQLLTANDTTWRLDISRDDIQHFPSSIDLTTDFCELGRQMTLRVVDGGGKGWKMMLTSYLDLDGRRSYCISYGWKEFVKAHNLEVGDHIIFCRIPSSKDNKELVIEFIRARNL